MAYDFQITVDSANPHTLADWWADALGWEVEPSDEAFIHKMIAKGYAGEDATTTHHGVLVWGEGAAIRKPDGQGRGILFQLVPEPKTVKNRVHLDVFVGADNVDRSSRYGCGGQAAPAAHAGRTGGDHPAVRSQTSSRYADRSRPALGPLGTT